MTELERLKMKKRYFDSLYNLQKKIAYEIDCVNESMGEEEGVFPPSHRGIQSLVTEVVELGAILQEAQAQQRIEQLKSEKKAATRSKKATSKKSLVDQANEYAIACGLSDRRKNQLLEIVETLGSLPTVTIHFEKPEKNPVRIATLYWNQDGVKSKASLYFSSSEWAIDECDLGKPMGEWEGFDLIEFLSANGVDCEDW